MKRSLLPLVAAALALLPVAGASASYDPLASATTTLHLEPSFASYLTRNSIAVEASAPATRKGAKLSLPLAEGEWDPTTAKGKVRSEGAIVLRNSRRRVPLRDLLVKANRTPLTAKVGGGQLKVAVAKSIFSKREGFGASFTARQLRLSPQAATRLNKKLRPREPFEAGQVLGTLTVRSQPATVTVLAQNRMTLTPTPEILAKLKSLFVSLNPIAPAELAPGPVLSFPIIVGGDIAPDGMGGTVRTGGEVELLQLGGGQVFWREQWLQPGSSVALGEANLQPSPPFGGKQPQAPLFSLSGGQVVSDPKARTVTITGATASLETATAEQMNQLFAEGKPVFAPGEAFGSVSFTAQGQ